MSLQSRKSSSVEEDLRAMLECDQSDEEFPEDDVPNKEEILKRAQDWQSLPADFIRTYSKGSKSLKAKCQQRIPNVWSFAKADELRHQTENTTCRCGVGEGFTFFLDNLDNKEFAANIESRDFHPDLKKPRNPAKNIATLIPEELHVKRYQRKGSLSLIQDDNTVQSCDHEAHPTRVPSRTPVTREEVIRLRDVFRRLLQEAGMGETLSQVVLEKRTDSEIERLVELVRAEQDVYNIVFHEIIRQVTLDCSERGEILSELRDFYARLLAGIPRIVMALHEENIVQRSLDRRLMEELLHFKIRLVQVVLGLDNVHHVYQQTKGRMCAAQEELKHALIEAQNTSRISDQLHGLYKMQKHRQEQEACSYARQREFWKSAACSLMSKVVNVYKLGLFRFLATSLDTWVQLAHKIMEERETKDNEQSELNFSYLRDWLGKVEDIILFMDNREQRVFKFANKMWHSLDTVANQLKAAISPDPAEFLVTPFEGGKAVTIHKALVQWTSQFTVELAQVEDGLEGSAKVEKSLGRLEVVRQSWVYQTESHILLPIRDDDFSNKVGTASEELNSMMKAAQPLLDEAFYKGIDPTIHKVEVDVRMWSKRNLRTGDLGRLQTELAKWSMNLQRSNDINSSLMWYGRRTNYSVVREKLHEKVDQYRATVVECLTSAMNDAKLGLADLQDCITQWTAECLLLAAPYHPSIPDPARRLIENNASSVDELGANQQQIKRRLALATETLDNSWQLVQEQGGRTYGDVGIDPATLSDMFRTEGHTWADLSDQCMAKLRSGEIFQPDITAISRGVNTEQVLTLVDRAVSTEDKSWNSWRSRRTSESLYETGSSAIPGDNSSEGSTAAGDESIQRLSSFGRGRPSVETELTISPRFPGDWGDPAAPASGGRPSLLVPIDSAEETTEQVTSGRSSTDHSSVASQLDVGNADGKKQSTRQRKTSISSNVKTSINPSTPSGAVRSRSRLASHGGGSRSALGASSSSIPGKRHRPIISGSHQRHRGSSSRSPPAALGRSGSRKRSSSRRMVQPMVVVRSHPQHGEPPPPVITAEAATSPMEEPSAERAAQTEFTGHMHRITFPDFMIELFAREMLASDSDQLVISTDAERERMTALQLHVQQVQELQQRLSERELTVQELHSQLAVASDDMSELTHKLRVSELKLINTERKLAASEEERRAAEAARAETEDQLDGEDADRSAEHPRQPSEESIQIGAVVEVAADPHPQQDVDKELDVSQEEDPHPQEDVNKELDVPRPKYMRKRS